MASTVEKRRFAGVVVAVIVLDLVTKSLAEARLPRWRSVPVLGDFFQLQLVYNPGAAFGLHVGAYSRWFFLALTVVALVVLGVMVWHTSRGTGSASMRSPASWRGDRQPDRPRALGPRGGGLPPLHRGPLRWPNFNVADMAVSCGAIALALALWREGGAGGRRGPPGATARRSAASPAVTAPPATRFSVAVPRAERLDRFLADQLQLSRHHHRPPHRRGGVLVNGAKARASLEPERGALSR